MSIYYGKHCISGDYGFFDEKQYQRGLCLEAIGLSQDDYQQLLQKQSEGYVIKYENGTVFSEPAPLPPEPSYQEKRAAEYPPIEDYIDAMVKINSDNSELINQGQQQLVDYYADCLEVKKKYPKE